jgi:hypothetical protein
LAQQLLLGSARHLPLGLAQRLHHFGSPSVVAFVTDLIWSALVCKKKEEDYCVAVGSFSATYLRRLQIVTT